MEKIESSLHARVRKDPKQTYPVVIVLRPYGDMDMLELPEYELISPSTLSARLTGEEIIRISKHRAVSFVKANGEAHSYG